jgi:hypothetical protein
MTNDQLKKLLLAAKGALIGIPDSATVLGRKQMDALALAASRSLARSANRHDEGYILAPLRELWDRIDEE